MEKSPATVVSGKAIITKMVSRLGDDSTNVDATPKLVLRLRIDSTNADATDATSKLMSRLSDDPTTVDAELPLILTEFTPFPRFPKELRLKIWGHTFPKGRYVSLDTYILDKGPQYVAGKLVHWDDQEKANVLEKRQTLPVALFVNGESREEALLHYTVVTRFDTWRHSSRFILSPVKPLCFDPKFDKAYMTHDMLWTTGPTISWFDKISLTDPTFFDRIETLDIRDFDTRPIVAYAGQLVPSTPANSPVRREKDIVFAKALLRFNNLKLVRFILTKHCSKSVMKKPAHFELWMRLLTTLFGQQTETWGDSIPKIELLGYDEVFSSADLKDGKVTMIAGERWPYTKDRLFLDGEVFM